MVLEFDRRNSYHCSKYTNCHFNFSSGSLYYISHHHKPARMHFYYYTTGYGLPSADC
jgi:hypothetical protein